MSDWIDDFQRVVGSVTDVLHEVGGIVGEPQTTVPKQATADTKEAAVQQPNTLPAGSVPPWLILGGFVVLLLLVR